MNVEVMSIRPSQRFLKLARCSTSPANNVSHNQGALKTGENNERALTNSKKNNNTSLSWSIGSDQATCHLDHFPIALENGSERNFLLIALSKSALQDKLGRYALVVNPPTGSSGSPRSLIRIEIIRSST